MSTKDCLNKFSKNLFWDVDMSQLQMNAHASYIIREKMKRRICMEVEKYNQQHG